MPEYLFQSLASLVHRPALGCVDGGQDPFTEAARIRLPEGPSVQSQVAQISPAVHRHGPEAWVDLLCPGARHHLLPEIVGALQRVFSSLDPRPGALHHVDQLGPAGSHSLDIGFSITHYSRPRSSGTVYEPIDM